MALKIRKIPMPVSQYPIKCPYGMTPTRIVIHNTANDAPAERKTARNPLSLYMGSIAVSGEVDDS